MLQGKELRDTCLGSATAGAVSRLLCHPLDTAKARLQGPDGGSFRSTWQVLRMTIETEGFRGLYRGIGAVLVGGTPGMCLYLTTYEATKDLLTEHRGGEGAVAGANFITHFWAGVLAEAVCCVVFVPVDVVKERLQVQQVPVRGGLPRLSSDVDGGRTKGPVPYTGSADALRTILKTEGLRGIYKGYAATLGSFGPFAALYFMFYEQAKATSKQLFASQPDQLEGDRAGRASVESAQRRGGGGEGLPVAVTLANAAGAAAAASWLTNPLDIAKLRLQVQRGVAPSENIFSRATSAVGKGAAPYSGMLDALSRIYRAGGLAGLFKGSGARMAFHAPSTAISMATFESAKGAWGSLLE